MATRVNLIQVSKYVSHYVLNSNYVKKCSNKNNGSFLSMQMGVMSLCQGALASVILPIRAALTHTLFGTLVCQCHQKSQ